jgi:hypothetical protein
MKDKNTGGPAFPATSGWDSQGNWCRSYADNEGMTLRDYFAAKAMQGWVQATTKPYVHVGEYQVDSVSEDHIAKIAYKMADAMLKAREA